MKSIRQINADMIVNDTLLTEKEVEVVRESVVTTAKATLNARDPLNVREVSEGRQTFEYYKIDTDSTDGAKVVRKGADYPQVEMEKTSTKVDLVKFGNSFELYREDILSAQDNGDSLPTQASTMAARQTSEKENDLILNGDEDFELEGLVDVAGSSVSSNSSSGWAEDGIDTFGLQDIVGDIVKTLKGVPDSLGNGPFTLYLTRGEFLHLQNVDANTDRNVMEVLNSVANINQIIWDPDMPEDTGLLVNTSPDVVEYVVAEDVNVVPIDNGDDETEEFKVRSRGAVVAYQPDGIVELTGI